MMPHARPHVPVLAAGLADVLVRHAHPPVGSGIEEHLLDQLPVALLHVGAVGEGAAAVLHTGRQVVAELLELGQGEKARAAARRARPTRSPCGARWSRTARRARPPGADLVEQGAPCGALVRTRARDERWTAWRAGQPAARAPRSRALQDDLPQERVGQLSAGSRRRSTVPPRRLIARNAASPAGRHSTIRSALRRHARAPGEISPNTMDSGPVLVGHHDLARRQWPSAAERLARAGQAQARIALHPVARRRRSPAPRSPPRRSSGRRRAGSSLRSPPHFRRSRAMRSTGVRSVSGSMPDLAGEDPVGPGHRVLAHVHHLPPV